MDEERKLWANQLWRQSALGSQNKDRPTDPRRPFSLSGSNEPQSSGSNIAQNLLMNLQSSSAAQSQSFMNESLQSNLELLLRQMQQQSSQSASQDSLHNLLKGTAFADSAQRPIMSSEVRDPPFYQPAPIVRQSPSTSNYQENLVKRVQAYSERQSKAKDTKQKRSITDVIDEIAVTGNPRSDRNGADDRDRVSPPSLNLRNITALPELQQLEALIKMADPSANKRETTLLQEREILLAKARDALARVDELQKETNELKKADKSDDAPEKNERRRRRSKDRDQHKDRDHSERESRHSKSTRETSRDRARKSRSVSKERSSSKRSSNRSDPRLKSKSRRRDRSETPERQEEPAPKEKSPTPPPPPKKEKSAEQIKNENELVTSQRKVRLLRDELDSLKRQIIPKKSKPNDPIRLANERLQGQLTRHIEDLDDRIAKLKAILPTESVDNLDVSALPNEGKQVASGKNSSKSTKEGHAADRPDENKAKSPETISCEYYDGGSHVCVQCNEIIPTLLEYLSHLHSDAHLMATESSYRPWLEEEAKNLRPQIRLSDCRSEKLQGAELMLSCRAFWCQVCKTISGDEICAEAHLKSQSHHDRYREFLAYTPKYEYELKSQKANIEAKMEKERRVKSYRENVKSKLAEEVQAKSKKGGLAATTISSRSAKAFIDDASPSASDEDEMDGMLEMDKQALRDKERREMDGDDRDRQQSIDRSDKGPSSRMDDYDDRNRHRSRDAGSPRRDQRRKASPERRHSAARKSRSRSPANRKKKPTLISCKVRGGFTQSAVTRKPCMQCFSRAYLAKHRGAFRSRGFASRGGGVGKNRRPFSESRPGERRNFGRAKRDEEVELTHAPSIEKYASLHKNAVERREAADKAIEVLNNLNKEYRSQKPGPSVADVSAASYGFKQPPPGSMPPQGAGYYRHPQPSQFGGPPGGAHHGPAPQDIGDLQIAQAKARLEMIKMKQLEEAQLAAQRVIQIGPPDANPMYKTPPVSTAPSVPSAEQFASDFYQPRRPPPPFVPNYGNVPPPSMAGPPPPHMIQHQRPPRPIRPFGKDLRQRMPNPQLWGSGPSQHRPAETQGAKSIHSDAANGGADDEMEVLEEMEDA